MIASDLKKLLTAGESSTVEFVAAFHPNEIAKAVCSLLNASGGRVVIGADHKGKVLGIKDAQLCVDELKGTIRSQITPQSMLSFSVETLNKRQMILVDVPAGYMKPYLVEGTIWLRRDATVTPARAEDVHQLILDRTRADQRWERRAALGVTLDALDVAEIKQAAIEIQRAGRRQFKSPDDPQSVLEELGLADGGLIFNSAVVLFGRAPTRLHSQLKTRFTVYQSDKTGSELLMDEVCERHLFSALERLMELFQRWIPVRSSFLEGSWQRRDQWDFPLPALREAVLNALVHRDFESPSGSVRIEVFPDRLSIWNIGSLPKGVTQKTLSIEHPSLPPNPDIANVCFQRGFIEQIGRGTVMIIEECQRARLQRPEWKSDELGTRLVFSNRASSLKAKVASFNQRQLTVLSKLEAGQKLTLTEYQELLGDSTVSDRTMRTDLAQLVEAGTLIRQGQGKGTFYVRTEGEADG